jgi:hypothetical protein
MVDSEIDCIWISDAIAAAAVVIVVEATKVYPRTRLYTTTYTADYEIDCILD